MPRFLVFPALFAAWFGAMQSGLTILTYVSFWLSLRLTSTNVRLSVFAPTNWSTSYFFWSCAMGALVGGVFAALDSRFHPSHNGADETLFHLLPNLLKSGAIAVALMLLYYVGFKIPLLLYFSRTPSAVSLYQNVYLWSNSIPLLLLATSLIWSIRKALHD